MFYLNEIKCSICRKLQLGQTNIPVIKIVYPYTKVISREINIDVHEVAMYQIMDFENIKILDKDIYYPIKYRYSTPRPKKMKKYIYIEKLSQ